MQRTAILARNDMLNTLGVELNSGFIDIYSGSQPATPETAAPGTLLVTLTFGNPAFGAASGGSMTAAAIASGTAVATGTAGWFRCTRSNHTTAVYDGLARGPMLAVTSIISANAVATVTVPVAHGLAVGDFVRIAGANQSDYNGTFQVTAVATAVTFSYVVYNSPVSPATGTITWTDGQMNLSTTAIVTSASIQLSSLVITNPQ